jgi:UDP-glucose 4-epimerase
MKVFITGVAGFIGSHLADLLLSQGHDVSGLDNLSSGFRSNVAREVHFVQGSIQRMRPVLAIGADAWVHCAAIARTPWCLDDPSLACRVNASGTQHVLEMARVLDIPRVVLCSSNVVYAAHTPYRATKEMLELWAEVYRDCYGLSTQCLRFSNVYGKRQSELGPSPNVFAALRKDLRELGYMQITGDGTQTRDFTHVSDIVRGIALAISSQCTDTIDLCTGRRWSLNEVAEMFGGPIRYIPPRPGDVHDIVQDPLPAYQALGWRSTIALPDGIKDCL